MEALIFNNKVVQLVEDQFPVAAPLFFHPAPEGAEVGWVYDPIEQQIIEPTIPEESMSSLITKLRKIVNEYFEQVARSRGYEGKEDLLTYQTSGINLFLNDANTFNTWRDSVWVTANQILNQVQNQQIARPTKDEFIAMLPTISW